MKNFAILFCGLVVCLSGCSQISYAINNPLGTIEGHDVYQRAVISINGKPCNVAYVIVDDFLNQRGESIEVLRAYYLPQHSPMFVRLYQVPSDRSSGFAGATLEELARVVQQENLPEMAPLTTRNTEKKTNEELFEDLTSGLK